MNNYICVNANYYKKDRIEKIQLHNTRVSDIDYLLPKTDYKNITDTQLEDEFEKYFNQQIEVQARRKSFTKKNGNTVLEMVVSLSEEKAIHYLNQEDGEQKLFAGYQQFQKDIEDVYGFKGLQVSLHTDEGYIDESGNTKYNIHAHLTFLNFNFKEEKTVLGYLKKDDWQDMQDVAANAFKKIGLDFKRGKKKVLATKDHLERNEYILKQQNKKLQEQERRLHSVAEEIALKQDTLQSLKETVTELKEKRKETTQLDVEIDEKKRIYAEITAEQKTLRDEQKQINSDIKELKAKKQEISMEIANIDSLIKQDTKKIIEYATTSTLLGDKIDSNKLAPAITKTLQKYSNYKFIAKVEEENKQLKSTIQNKDETLLQQDQYIQTVNKENQSLLEKIKTFVTEKKQIVDSVNSLKESINGYVQKIKEQTKKINLYESIFKKHNIDLEKEIYNGLNI